MKEQSFDYAIGGEPLHPRQKGWILLAVQFRDAGGMTGLFRIEYFHTYRPPEREDMTKLLTGDEYGTNTFYFEGEKWDAQAAEWIEKCQVQIPGDAYLMASWKYYAHDDPKWESPKIDTPAESQS